MAKENPLLKEAQEKGLVDDRNLFFASDVSASNGNSGRTWAFLNGTKLYLYELIFPAGLGAEIEVLELKDAKLLKASSFVLAPKAELSCGGISYSFRNFSTPKQFVAALQEICGK